ncbi:MAG: hypothetical protein NC341_02350 [Blautia sp.]|nr:hypothetical protein [Blautia sp.]
MEDEREEKYCENKFFTYELVHIANIVPCGIKYRGMRERNGYFNGRGFAESGYGSGIFDTAVSGNDGLRFQLGGSEQA